MADLRGLHAPHCNIRCAGEAHWFGEVGPLAEHAHAHRQARFCSMCAEREAHILVPAPRITRQGGSDDG